MKSISHKQIASQSGVSPATICRFFNNSSYVGKNTRKKILDAMKALDMDISSYEEQFSPNSKLIIFNIPNLENQFYNLIIQGANMMAKRSGYEILLTVNLFKDEQVLVDFIAFMKKIHAAGFVSTNHLPLPWIQKIADAIPFVQCCECVQTSTIPFVTIDDVKAAMMAVNYLISKGRKRIGLINGPLEYKYAQDRLKGYKQALQEANIEYDPSIVYSIQQINYEMALATSMQLLNSDNKPDAIFAVSDAYAAAALRASYKFGLSVPKDLSIIGFDNIPISEMCVPSISTVNQPKFQLGMTSCEMLIKMIDNVPFQNKQMFLNTELILRETTEAY